MERTLEPYWDYEGAAESRDSLHTGRRVRWAGPNGHQATKDGSRVKISSRNVIVRISSSRIWILVWPTSRMRTPKKCNETWASHWWSLQRFLVILSYIVDALFLLFSFSYLQRPQPSAFQGLFSSGVVNNYKSGMPLKFSVYDRDFSYKDHRQPFIPSTGRAESHGMMGFLVGVFLGFQNGFCFEP